MFISRSPSRARISVSIAPERAVLAAPIPAAASSSIAACGRSLPRRWALPLVSFAVTAVGGTAPRATPLCAACAVVAVSGIGGVETPRPNPPRPSRKPPRSPPRLPRPSPPCNLATVCVGRPPVDCPPADARSRFILLGNRLETLTERQPCRRVPRLRLQARPVFAVCAKGRVGKGGCPTGCSPGTARPEVRAYVSGCPAPAGHGTS